MTTGSELAASGVPHTPAAPRGRRRTGLALMWVAAAVGVTATLLAASSEHVVVALGGVVVTAPVLVACVGGAALVAVVGHLLSRRPGPFRRDERNLAIALVGPVVLTVFLLVIPLVGFFVLLLLAVGVQALVAPGPVLVALAVVAGCAAVLIRVDRAAQAPTGTDPDGTRRPAAHRPVVHAITTTVLLMTVAGAVPAGVGWAVMRIGDDVASAHEPGGCTAVVRQTQLLFTGSAVVYVARPGSVLAHRHEEHPLEESFPFRTGDHTLTAGPDTVHVAFDDGRGTVNSRIRCT